MFFSDPINSESIEVHKETEKGHGRIERRICRKTNVLEWLTQHNWAGLKSVFAVRRIVTSKAGKTDETGYYISSLELSAEEFLHISRARGVESMHWMKIFQKTSACCFLITAGRHLIFSENRLCLSIVIIWPANQKKKHQV
jgi:hypothetical protein